MKLNQFNPLNGTEKDDLLKLANRMKTLRLAKGLTIVKNFR